MIYHLQPDMLNKLRDVQILLSFSRPKPTDPPQTQAASSSSSSSSSPTALKIIHAGGMVERYYMAVPAKRIIDKYPSFLLAKIDVFRRPWDSVVPPDRILKPGEKFYVVPRRTLKKLQHKTKKANYRDSLSMPSLVSQTTSNDMSVSDASGSFTSACKKETSIRKHGNDTGILSDVSGSAFNKKSSSGKRVRFVGIDKTTPSKVEDKSTERVNGNAQAQGKKRRPRNSVTWQPALDTINEKNNE